MLFNSLEYLVFLPLSWIAFWAAPSHWRVHVMLVASYVFYASWSVPYAAMIFGLVVMNYVFGLILGRATQRRKAVLAAFEQDDGSYRVMELPIERCAAIMRPTSSQGPSAGGVGMIDRKLFEDEGCKQNS